MKKHLPSILPALALFTLGGCAVSSNLATTENDGMYYSATDKVTAASVPVAQSGPNYAPGDVPNPDYGGSAARNGQSEYYDDDYYATTPRRNGYNNSYRGGSLGYYNFPYADPFYYGAPVIAYSPYSAFGYSPYGFYDPFYRPYYGYGGLTVNIGFGFGRSFYRPFGYSNGFDQYYGYGYGGYGNPYGAWGGGLGGYYYGGGYGGRYGNGYNNGYYGANTDNTRRNVTYGPRRSRTGNGAGLTDVSNAPGNATSLNRSRVVQDARFAEPVAGNNNASSSQYSGRVRPETAGAGSTSAANQPTSTLDPVSRSSRYRGTQSVQSAASASQPEGNTRRWRVLDNSATNGTQATERSTTERSTFDQPQSGRSRRATYYGGDNSGTQSQSIERPRRQRMSDASSAPSRSESEPTRSYSQPEPSRSYSMPSRPSAPSSSPSRSSSGGGGGGRGRVR